MKVLWAVNLIPQGAAAAMHLPGEILGGWVEAMSQQLCCYGDVELGIACKTGPEQHFCETIQGITYYSLAYSSKTSLAELLAQCRNVLQAFQPDLVHIEGTEFLHAKAMQDTAREAGIPCVVSMQGILNGQYQYQCGQLPIADMMLSCSLTNIFAAWMLHLRKKFWYRPRMLPERQIIEAADYILGRTTWDRAHCYAINPHAHYYSCNRILRTAFYETAWNLEQAERHSLYVGNGYFALKGLHFLIMALPELIRDYPDLKVYVAGHEPYRQEDTRTFFKKGYAAYLRKLIRDLQVENHVVFTGPLNAKQVAERLSQVHAYVLCSAIENSPNTLGEAMLVGTPCVAAYVGGVADMADDGKEALFYRNDDPALLAWNVRRIFTDDNLACHLSANARARAAVTHNPQRNADQLVNAYRDILQSS
jgi:glycosyltransferase involved in cell wall biosynthesis